MPNFSHTQLFHSNVLRSMFNQDRETYHQVVQRAFPPHAISNIFEMVSLTRLFKQDILANAGDSIHVKNLLGGVRFSDDTKEWLEAGGSPLMATRHTTRHARDVVPLLGYRQSIAHSKALGSLLRAKPAKLEQWLLGTDPEMVTSSLVRGFMTGVFHYSDIGKMVPKVLFEHLGDDGIKKQVGDFFRSFEPSTKSYDTDMNLASTAYTFSRLGHPELVDAIKDSPKFRALTQFPRTAVQALIAGAFGHDYQSVEATLDFCESFFGIDRLDPMVDDQLAESASRLSGAAWGPAIEIFLTRFEMLKEAGKLTQAVGWLREVLPNANGFPEIPEDQKAAFAEGVKDSYDSQKGIFKIMGMPGQGVALPWLISALGKQGVLNEYRNACLMSARGNTLEHERRLVDETLIGFDPKLLDEHGLLHSLLDVLHEIYPDIWGQQGDVKPSRIESQQATKLATWVAGALSVAKSNEANEKWLALLDQPNARKALLVSMPMTPEMLKSLSHEDRAARFTHELGV